MFFQCLSKPILFCSTKLVRFCFLKLKGLTKHVRRNSNRICLELPTTKSLSLFWNGRNGLWLHFSFISIRFDFLNQCRQFHVQNVLQLEPIWKLITANSSLNDRFTSSTSYLTFKPAFGHFSCLVLYACQPTKVWHCQPLSQTVGCGGFHYSHILLPNCSLTKWIPSLIFLFPYMKTFPNKHCLFFLFKWFSILDM